MRSSCSGRIRPDVTLMDLRLPDLSGTEAIRAIRAEFSAGADHRALDVRRRRRDPHGARGRRARLPGEDRPARRTRRYHPQGRGGSASCSAGARRAAAAALATLAPVAARARSAQADDRWGSAIARSPRTSTSRRARSRFMSATSSLKLGVTRSHRSRHPGASARNRRAGALRPVQRSVLTSSRTVDIPGRTPTSFAIPLQTYL